jgi:hypothetical protein
MKIDVANLLPRRAHHPVNRYTHMEEMYRNEDEGDYRRLVTYLRGEQPKPKFVNMGCAEEAKRLIEEDPSLLLPRNREELLRKVRGYGFYRQTKPRPMAVIRVGLYRVRKKESFSYQCAVCGADADAFPVCAEGRDEIGPVRVCERCLEADNIDEHLAQRAADLEARAATEQNGELEVEARDARSLIGRLEVRTIEAWRWLASRDAAAQTVDIETCTIYPQAVQMFDPYGLDVSMPEEWECVGKYIFVVSDATNGGVYIDDLPEKKRNALYERIKREHMKREEDERLLYAKISRPREWRSLR